MNGENRIGSSRSSAGQKTFEATNPATDKTLPAIFHVATPDEVDKTLQLAQQAYLTYKKSSGSDKANFLDAIAEEVQKLGDTLIQRAVAESGLPEARILGERGRTIAQLKSFASLLREGSWVEATIDNAEPDRQPLPKPDVRKMLCPVGPVVVFTASNFPLAFSTAGGDTASALAAGNPVIVKAHPSHPGTNQLVTDAILEAAKRTGVPDGVFSTLYDDTFEVGLSLVNHPLTQSVAFTGSFSGGMALYKEAISRDVPIPVFAEMGSTNPTIILPDKLKSNVEDLAQQLTGSISLGAGQFCTKPGLIALLESTDQSTFLDSLKDNLQKNRPSTMLNKGICDSYKKGLQTLKEHPQVKILAQSESTESCNSAVPTLATVSLKDFKENKVLQEELFGPFSLLVLCKDQKELLEFTEILQGQLTTSIFATDLDVSNNPTLISSLEQKAGRIVFNGVPAGVEVCSSMHHGGPFPASTDSRFTSVGTDAIKRFVRAISYQNAPDNILPEELKNDNPLNIWRKVNSNLTKE